MFTPAALSTTHELTHSGTAGLISHCRQLTTDELHRELAGFGLPSVQRQLHHIVEAEKYWIDVLADRFKDYDLAAMEADLGWQQYTSTDRLEAYRLATAKLTQEYLESATVEGLNTVAQFRVWPDNRPQLIPAQVLMRIVSHAFHHRGQVAAMCRLLGYPIPPLNFPVKPAP